MISRAEVQNALLALYTEPSSYLEIGVSRGTTFDEVESARKVAVDPKFRFDVPDARERSPNATYHEVTSDVYFGDVIDLSERFDVIYIDGLHTAEQTLRDFTNALNYVTPAGVIIIDDVVPSTYTASLREQRQSRQVRLATNAPRGWMGDVYQLVFFIETFHQQLSYATIEENHGQLVVWPERRESAPDRTIEAVGRASYADIHLQRSAFRFMPFETIVGQVGASIRRIRHGVPETSESDSAPG